MTPFTAFEPGSELECNGCQFATSEHPGCLIAIELLADKYEMSARCCPRRAAA